MAEVLVTGANGFLGSWLVRRLLTDGHQVTCLVRPTSDLTELKALEALGLRCKYAFGDVTQPDTLVAAFQGQEAVFHLAGFIAYRKADRAMMQKVNVDGTNNVVRACLKVQTPRLIHLSSVVAIGASFNDQLVLTEDFVFNLKDLNLGYFETKRQAEAIVMSAVQEKGLNAVILNPSTIYGPGDALKGSRKTQVKVAQGRFKFYTGGGVNVVPVENCVDGIVRAWLNGRSGERYILAGQNLTIKDLLGLIAKAAGVPAPSIRIPNWVLHVLGIVGDFKTKMGRPASLSRENAWTTTMFHWFDSGKAQRQLGFVPGSSKLAIESSVKWMKEKGLIQ